MKKIVVIFIIALILIVYVGTIVASQDSTRHSQAPKSTSKVKSEHQHESMKSRNDGGKDSNLATSAKEIVGQYLRLKNSLVTDKTEEAAAAGTALEAAFKKYDKKGLSAAHKEVFAELEDDAREHAEHIGANSGNIAHQREHFDMLSKDIYDLVKAFGSDQVLYKDFCPMYNDKKGAIWLSETKGIKNPYFGKQMPTCGSVQEEIK